MSERSFTHLHTHTEFSMLDGAARVGDLVAAAVADGQPALGITDHGNMYGVLDFYKACRDQGIVPIIGTESYMAGESRHERPVRRGRVDDTGGDVEGGQKLYYHLTLLAETVEGYRNLMQLSSAAYLEGYYYKPRVDWELLERHHNGLIATTGCLGGVVLQALLAGDVGGGRAAGRSAAGHLRPGQPLRRAAGPRHRRPAPHQPAADRDRPPHRRPAAGHQRQPLHPPRGRRRPRRPAVRADRCAALRHQPLQVRGHRALPQERPPRCAISSARSPRRATTRCSSRERADVQIELGKPSLPEFPVPDRFTGETYEERALAYLRDLTMEGARERYGVAAAARGGGAARLRAGRHREHGLRRLLPRRVGPDPLRPRVGHPGRARAAGRRPAAASPTACGSWTSTPSATTCSSSAS